MGWDRARLPTCTPCMDGCQCWAMGMCVWRSWWWVGGGVHEPIRWRVSLEVVSCCKCSSRISHLTRRISISPPHITSPHLTSYNHHHRFYLQITNWIAPSLTHNLLPSALENYPPLRRMDCLTNQHPLARRRANTHIQRPRIRLRDLRTDQSGSRE